MTISHLTGGYRGTAVVKDLSLTLPRGEITALVGPNGCGKTTLLRLCGRLLRPMAGTIRLPDSSGTQRDIAAFSPKEFARLAAVLPQVRAVPSLPVGALVAHGRFPHLAYPRRLSGEDRRLVRPGPWRPPESGSSGMRTWPSCRAGSGRRRISPWRWPRGRRIFFLDGAHHLSGSAPSVRYSRPAAGAAGRGQGGGDGAPRSVAGAGNRRSGGGDGTGAARRRGNAPGNRRRRDAR